MIVVGKLLLLLLLLMGQLLIHVGLRLSLLMIEALLLLLLLLLLHKVMLPHQILAHLWRFRRNGRVRARLLLTLPEHANDDG